MISLPTSIILLSVTTLLIFLGFLRATLDRMRLSDTATIIILVLLMIAHFMPTIGINQYLGVHLGVFIPVGVTLYLLITTSNLERLRALVITVITTVLLWATDQVFTLTPDHFFLNIDPIYMPGVLAGIVAYVSSRSRRSAFIAGVNSVIFLDLISMFSNIVNNLNSQVILGGAGIFDAITISGVIAVMIAEIIGEIRERIYRGPAKLSEQDGDDID